MSLVGLQLLGSLRNGQARLGQAVYSARRYMLFLAFCGTSFVMTSAYIYEVFPADGPSMYPTLPDTTVLLGTNKRYCRGRGIQIGDCINFKSPLFPRQTYNKRVVGMPGDYVLRSRSNCPTPGGAPLCGITDWRARVKAMKEMDEFGGQEALALQGHEIPEDEQEWDEPQMIQVPEGHVWVEGDNLAWSRDSRFYGPLPMALIQGRSSWWSDGYFSRHSLNPGKGLRKVEEWEMDDVLGTSSESSSKT